MDLRPLERDDLPAARALLTSADLPTDDFDDPTVELVGAFVDATLIGVIGHQACGDVGLLRSLAVVAGHRNAGIAAALCAHVLAASTTEMWLLTTTAHDYFARHGFVEVSRELAPPSIQATAQFSTLCPSSARVMRRVATRTATCACGQLSIVVHGETLGTGVCHCLACQRRTGSVFAALAAFAAPYEVTGSATEYVRTGDAGGKVRFRFCPVCGTSLFHTEDGGDGSVVLVAVGGFGDPAFPAPQDSVYDCRRHAWVQLPAGLATYEKDPT